MKDPKRCDVCNGVLANDLGPGSCVCTDHPRHFKIPADVPARIAARVKHQIDVLEYLQSVPAGETITKFVAVDKSTGGDFGVELHGFYGSDGHMVVTNTIVDRRVKSDEKR